eukprot:Skav215487  [mRNA]  locus=scaffold165:315633:317678:+ [translate_table: standard]
MISRGTLLFLGLCTAYSTPVEVPYVPAIDIRRNETVSREAGACRVSGFVDFSYPPSGDRGPSYSGRYSCKHLVCEAFRAAIAQKLSGGEEVSAYQIEPFRNQVAVWCSYLITFNSTFAMEAAGIHQFLRQKEFFLEYLSSHFSFPSDAAYCQSQLVTINRVTEPITSWVAATTSVAHWRVGKKSMHFSFSFKFNPRADLPPPHADGSFDKYQKEQYLEAMQFHELLEEIQQLLWLDDFNLDGCNFGRGTHPGSWTTCHTSDTGAACECESPAGFGQIWHSCRAKNCSRNCSPTVYVSCSTSYPPSVNGGALSSSYNETLSALLVNGTEATFDPSELQVMEHAVEFDCHQSVEVVIGVEKAFEVLCPDPVLERWGLDNPKHWAQVMSRRGLLWKQSPALFRPFVRLVALESALGNSSDAWVNVTLNLSSLGNNDQYYYANDKPWPLDDHMSHTVYTPVHLSIHITRPEPATEMWTPEAISVPCLVEQKAFELVVKFTGAGRMSDLRGDSYPESPIFGVSGSGVGDVSTTEMAALFAGPVADVLWSRPGRQSYKMPQEELAAWRLRRNESGKPSDRHIIRSIQATNSSKLTLTLVPPAGGRDTTWSLCFFPADGFHVYEEICTASFPVRQSQAECSDLSSNVSSDASSDLSSDLSSEVASDLSSESSMGQRLRIVWLFLLCMQ